MDADYLELMMTSLNAARSLPIERRVRVYRALSRIITDETVARELRSLADGFLHLEERSRAVDFSFSQKTFDK
jgi:hypothetical protein